jgi:TolB protein
MVLATAALLVGLGAASRPARAASPVLTAKIAFDSTRDGNREIYLMNRDGSDPTNLTDNLAIDRFPAWSPDGRQIAFSSDRDGALSLYVMNADGSNVHRLTDGAPDTDATWTDDGRIVFDRGSFCEPGTHLYIVNADGGDEHALTSGSTIDCFAAASPRADRLVFDRSTDDGATFHLYALNLDGSGLQQLTNVAGFSEQFPSWSPDGERLAFDRYDDATGGGAFQELYTMNANGGDVRQVTNTLGRAELRASWSPGGSELVFSAVALTPDGGLGPRVIYTIKPNGRDETQLTSEESNNTFPAWQPLVTPSG